MKKTTIFSSALVALAMLASCQKEELFETPATATGVTEFTATIGQPTKTAIDPYGKITWIEGNEITVTDAASHSAVYVAASSGDRTTFTLREDQTAVGDGPYTATYGDINKQVYDKDGANCPLTAATTDASTTDLHFSSPYAVVKVTAKSSDDDKTVKTVVVKYGNSSSILDCQDGDGVELTSGGVDFYVAVRPATNAALSVSFYTADKMATKTRTEPISLAAKDLLPVTLDSFDWSPQKTFKAVYNTNGGVNTLTFYYDAVNYSGDGITVYEDGTANRLFDDSKDNWLKWGYDDKRESINSVVINKSVADYPFLTNTAYMFFNMTAANSISGAEHLDVSNVTNMSNMFANFGSQSNDLNKVPDVRGWDTGNVTNMTNMFNSYGKESTSLTAPPEVSQWNTGNVTDMSYMFSGYGKESTSLTDVPDVSKWKTDKVEKMGNLFANYGNANNIDCKFDLTGWNLAKLTTGNVFYNFKPKTFVVTIPAKTGKNANQPGTWYGSDNGNGTAYSFDPPTGKYFIPVLIGVFTVSDEKKVRFSQGNLWYGKEKETDGTSTWYFETNQYDVQSSFGDVLHVGHFFWSKSDNVAYETSYNDGSAATDDVFFTNKKTETEETAKTDFTSSGKMGFWRTLSKAEWTYLLEDRTMTNGKARYSNAMEVGVTIDSKTYKGIFLYPDNYNGDIVSGSMTLEQINAAGIVFLPSTGFRNNSTNIGESDISCIYWTSTAAPNGEEGPCAYRMFFQWDGSDLSTDFNAAGYRYWAVGIRLVTDCQ